MNNEKPINSKTIELGKALKEAIKLECGIPNATEAEFNRAAHLFMIDMFIKYLQDDKEIWQSYKVGEFESLDILHTNCLYFAIKDNYDDEHFDAMADLVSKHEEALLEKLTEHEVENWWEE